MCNIPHRLMCLNTWCPDVDIVLGAYDPLESRAQLADIRASLGSHILGLLPDSTF